MADYDIQANITANTKGYEDGVKKAQNKTNEFSKSLSDLTKKISKLFIGGSIAKSIMSMATSIDEAKSAIVKGTGAIGEELTGLTDSLNTVLKSGVSKSVQEVGTMIADLNTRFGVTGEVLEKMTGDMDKFSRVTGTDSKTAVNSLADVMTKWNIPLSDSTDLLDQLTRAGQISGASVTSLMDGLKTGESTFAQFGMNITQSTAFLAMLSKNGIDSSTALLGMRTALTKFSSQGKNAEKEFQKISEKIKSAKSDSDALSIAIDTFGTRAGTEMVRALRGSNSSLEDFQTQLKNAGGTLVTTAKQSKTTKEALNELKSTFAGLSSELAGDTNNALVGLIDKFREFIAQIDVEKIKSIFEDIKDYAMLLYDYFSAILKYTWDNVKTLLNAIVGAVNTFSFQDFLDYMADSLDNMFKIFQDIFNAIIAVLHGDFPLAWEYTKLAVLRAVDAILDGISFILNSFPKLVNGVITGVNKIIDGINKVRGWMGKDPFDEVKFFSEADLSAITGVEDKVEETVKKIEEMTGKSAEKSIKDMKTTKKTIEKTAIDTIEGEIEISDVVVEQSKKQKNVIVKTFEQVSSKVRSVFYDIQAWLKKYHIPKITETLVKGIKGTVGVIKTVLSSSLSVINKLLEIDLFGENGIADTILKFEDSILTFVLETLPQLPGFVHNALQGFSLVLQQVMDSMNAEQFQEWFTGIFYSLSDSIPTIIEQIIEITLSLLQEFINSLSSWVDNGGFQTLINSVFEGFKSILNFVLDNLPQLLEMAIRIVTDIVTEIINILPDVIQKIITTIVNLIPSLITSVIDSIGELIPAIIEFIPKIIKAIAEAIPDVVTAILNMIPDIIDSIVNVIVQIIPAIVDIIPQLIKILVETIPDIVTSIIDALPGIIVSIVDAVAEIIPAIIGIIPDLIVALINALPDIVTAIVLALPQIIASVISAILQLIPTIISFVPKIAVEIVNSFISFFTNFSWSSFADFGKRMVEGIAQGFGNIWNTLKSAWQAFVDGFKKFFGIHSPSTLFESFGNFMVEGLLNGFKNIGELFSNIWEGLKNIVLGFRDWFVNAFSNIGSWFKNTFSNIGDWFSDTFSNMKTTVSTWCDNSKKAFSKIGTFFKDTWSSAKDWFGDIFSNMGDGISSWVNFAKSKFLAFKSWLKNTFSNIGDWFKNIFSNMGDGIQNIGSNIGEFFTNAWGNISDVASDIWDGISSTASNIWEGTKNVASTIGESIKNFFGKLKFWETGVNNAPRGLAVVGEAGPELVDFRGGERVYNSQATRGLLQNSSSSGNNGNTFNVSFYNTKDTTAFEMLKQMKQYNREMAINGVL